MQRKSKINQIRSNQKLRNQDEYKYFDGGEEDGDAPDQKLIDADAAVKPEEFEEKKNK